MSYFEFPHTRNYDGDLGYVIKTLNKLTERYNNFFEYNSIKFHDPIEWSIETVYTAFEIVFDEGSEAYYISKTAVPAGIGIDNADFWLLITPFKTDTVLNTDSLNPIANKTVATKFGTVDNSLSAISTDIVDMKADILNNAESISNETASRIDSDNIINARIDEIASLPEGSTSGDAELIDIRVGGNGITYPTAGDAVRGQYTELNNKFNAITEKTDNLWTLLADSPFTTSLIVPIVLTPDTYTISVEEIVSSASGTSSRIEFFNSNDERLSIVNESIIHPASENYLTLNRTGATPLSFTLQATTAYVKIYSSNTASASTGNTATWKKVMILKGKYNDKGTIISVPYISPATAVDIVARSALSTKLLGKKIVNFGDSIFGNFTAPTDISTFIADMTGATVYNCGFGGTRMTDNSEYGDKGYFSMCKLAEAITTGIYTPQLQALARMGSDPVVPIYTATLNRLMSIDFTDIDIITFEHATNDWYGNTTLSGGSGNLVFENALNYVINTICNTFPNIRIVIISPIYRYFSATSDSNNYVNTKGNTLIDYIEVMKETAEKYNFQFINDYYIGINKFSHAYYLSDGTHPTEAARKLIAANISKELY